MRVIEKFSTAIGAELRGDEARSFLLDAGVPNERCPTEIGRDDAGYIPAVLSALLERGASGRRVVRDVIGRWIADELEVGPSVEQRATLVDELARAGWRPKRSTLVIAPPSKPTRYQPPSARPAATADIEVAPDPNRARKVMVVYGRDNTAEVVRIVVELRRRSVGLTAQTVTGSAASGRSRFFGAAGRA